MYHTIKEFVLEDIYETIVDEKLFNKIYNGKCNHYIFINDRKRLQYKIGNILTFKNADKVVKVEIFNMFFFTNVKDLLDMMGKEKFGFTIGQTTDKIEDSYYVNYKASDIEKFGLVAVEFNLL